MGRSVKKGPYVDARLLKRVLLQKQTGSREALKTWSRSCTIVPEFVGHNFSIHNGNRFVALFVAEAMVGHKLGEFALTRNFHTHQKG